MNVNRIYWHNFCVTYDVRFLSLLDPKVKNIVKTFIHNNVKFKGLQKIIELYFNKQTIPKYDILTDILSLSYHTSSIYFKNIYLFGEDHYPGKKCNLLKINEIKKEIKDERKGIKCVDFIIENITKIPKFIDLFLELPIQNNSYSPFSNNLLKLTEQKRDNIRIHNSDIRNIDGNNFFIELSRIADLEAFVSINDLNNYIIVLDHLNHFLTSEKYIKDRKVYEHVIEKQSYKNFMNYIISIYNQFKLNKQYESAYKPVQKLLIDHFEESIKKLNLKYFKLNTINKLLNSLPRDKLPTGDMKDLLYTICNDWIDLTVPIFDIYLFSRVFRTFRQVKYKNSKPPENIIIYTGNYHAEVYRKLLKKLAFKQEFISNTKEKNFCINISKLKQPLFS